MPTQPPEPDSATDSDIELHNADVCNVVGAVAEVGSKWKLVVLNDLQDDEKRFNELKRSTGASSYTLSRVLADLEDHGLVDNRKELESPVASYYTVTEKGRALSPVFEALDEWGATWLD
ncbi:transcription regulator [Natrialba hulunbeirensis JCM 10989]|uniref:Transcription regulator n=1 Tax=Natrialba hulunbeirensis JCM 10989 TaxID=1227493 RepID=M0A7U7_9EURY|nr:helix-turn-helix domain-containing protein [Natrialba hulunbeirensis]ELY93413.1 transcription regulator [Natrialba hulunbeirensis JCM 10989]